MVAGEENHSTGNGGIVEGDFKQRFELPQPGRISLSGFDASAGFLVTAMVEMEATVP